MVGWAGNRRTLTEWTDACASLCLVGPFSQGDACAKLELSQKIFNFTEDQDLKIKVGLDVLRRNVYAQIRENNWTLSTDMRGSWHVSYDL